jgi:hypothetical protein
VPAFFFMPVFLLRRIFLCDDIRAMQFTLFQATTTPPLTNVHQ